VSFAFCLLQLPPCPNVTHATSPATSQLRPPGFVITSKYAKLSDGPPSQAAQAFPPETEVCHADHLGRWLHLRLWNGTTVLEVLRARLAASRQSRDTIELRMFFETNGKGIEDFEAKVGKPGAASGTASSTAGTVASPDADAKQGSCDHCGSLTSNWCPCKTARYCSKACQQKMWPEHKEACRKARAEKKIQKDALQKQKSKKKKKRKKGKN
jgi:hypothetical protein